MSEKLRLPLSIAAPLVAIVAAGSFAVGYSTEPFPDADQDKAGIQPLEDTTTTSAPATTTTTEIYPSKCYDRSEIDLEKIKEKQPGQLWVGSNGRIYNGTTIYQPTAELSFDSFHKIDQLGPLLDSSDTIKELSTAVNYLIGETGIKILFGADALYPETISFLLPHPDEIDAHTYVAHEDVDRLRINLRHIAIALMTGAPTKFWQESNLKTISLFNAYSGLAAVYSEEKPKEYPDERAISHMTMKLLAPDGTYERTSDIQDIVFHEVAHGHQIVRCTDKSDLTFDPKFAEINPPWHIYDNSERSDEDPITDEQYDGTFVNPDVRRKLNEEQAELTRLLFTIGLRMPEELEVRPLDMKHQLVALQMDAILPGMAEILVAIGRNSLVFETGAYLGDYRIAA